MSGAVMPPERPSLRALATIALLALLAWTIALLPVAASAQRINNPSNVDVSTGSWSDRVQKLRRAAAAAATFNPEDAPVATGVTLTVATSADASLTKSYPVGSNAALYRFSGGRMTMNAANTRAYFPVASILPATSGGNLATNVGSGDLNAWGWEVCYSTEAVKSQIKATGFTSTNYSYFFTVDGRYISKSPTVNVANGDNYFAFDFSTAATPRALRTICMLGSGQNGFYSASVDATSNISAPAPSPDRIVAFSTGDSYSEGQGASPTGQPAWAKELGRLKGWGDVRQVAVGGTGYLATGTGRSTVRQQIARWFTINSDITPAQVDVVTLAAGYNDSGTSAASIQAEALLTMQAIRAATNPNALVIVLGSWGGRRGPDANTVNIENAVLAAFNQWADAHSIFIPVSTDPSPWFFGTGYVGATNGSGNSDFNVAADGTHPSNAGADVLARRASAKINAALAQLVVP